MPSIERPPHGSHARRQLVWPRLVALLVPVLVLAGCAGDDTPSGTNAAGSLAGSEANSTTAAPPSAEPSADRPVAVDEEGERASATPVEPPSAESLADRTVAVDEEGERASATPVEPTETAAAESDGEVLVQLANVEFVDGEAIMPGEVAGPAVRMTIEVVNRSAEALDTSGSVVNVAYGADRAPANTFQRPGGTPIPGHVEAGDTVVGVYLFDVPVDDRDDVRIEVDIAPELQMVVFEGDLSTW